MMNSPRWNRILALAACLLALASEVSAQAPVSRYRADTLTVEALRAPASLDAVPFSVNRRDLTPIVRGETGLSLAPALDQVPGVMVAERHNLSQGDRLVVRGIGARASFGVRGVRLLVDGIPLTMADGQSQLGVVDLAQMASVEVIRGPAAALYGNAAGGVLQLQSAPVTASGAEVSAFVGSDGLFRLRARAEVAGARDQVQIGLSRTDHDGARQHADSRQQTAQLRWVRTLSESLQLAVTSHAYDAPWLYNPSSLDRTTADADPGSARFFVRQQGAAKQVRHAQLGASLRWQLSDVTDGELAIHGVSRTLDNPIPGRLIDLDRTAAGLRVVGRHAWSDAWETTAGLEWEHQSDTRREFVNEGLPDGELDRYDDDTVFDRIVAGEQQLDQEESATGAGLFAMTRWSPAPAWTISAGLRMDRHAFEATDRFLVDGDDSGDRSLTQWSPTAGVAYSPSRRLTLYANIATAYLTPTTVELGNRADGRGGFNADLDPEHYRSVEGGARFLWVPGRLDGEVAVYQLDLQDMLLPFGIAGSDEVFYRNASAARNRGAELLVTWTPRSAWEATASLSVNDFVFADHVVESGGEAVRVDGNEVPGVPPFTATARVSWRPTRDARLSATVRHTARMFGNDLNGPPPGSDTPQRDFESPAATLVGLRGSLGRDLGGWGAELFLGVDNLLGQEDAYSIVPNAFGNRFFEPAPGRTWFGGVTVSR